jgi:3-oxoacyl-[acyl-carrier protein] reductase
MSKLQGKVALVTGASKGIGAGIAVALAAEGAAVAVNYSSDSKGAEATVTKIKAAGGKAVAVQGSVAVAADVERIFAETEKAFGKITHLVNNAGVYKFAALADFDEAEFHRQFNTNVLGVFLASKRALQSFGTTGGNIINIGSSATLVNLPTSSTYTATKGALDSITAVLAKELGPQKIRVNSVNPGPVVTEGTLAMEEFATVEQVFVPQTPLGRVGQPDDIAKLVTFLASEDSYWLTGEHLAASGGLR